MARTVLAVSVVLLSTLFLLTGCHDIDSGRSQLLPPPMKKVPIVEASEADIIEQMSIDRLAYRQYLESLVAYYKNTGNNMKLRWARNELKKLNKIPQYNYIIEASVAGPELKATDSITIADYMYDEAYRMEKRARRLILITDDNMLRMALDKYNQLIRKYPSSNKIDDAAYMAAGIYEYFKDYKIAVIYYQRTYQWNPNTTYPAMFKAAYILDEQLHHRAEALGLYQEVVKKKNLSEERREFVKKRIAELTESGVKLEETE